MGWQSTNALRISPTPSCRLWQYLLPNVAHVTTHGLRYRLAFRTKYALKAEVNRLQRSVTRRLNEWRNDQWSATLESLHPEDQSL